MNVNEGLLSSPARSDVAIYLCFSQGRGGDEKMKMRRDEMSVAVR